MPTTGSLPASCARGDTFEGGFVREVLAPFVQRAPHVLDVGAHVGMHTLAYAHLSEARRALQTELPPFDIVLTDLKLPDGSGLDVVKDAHARSSASLVAIITGYASLETAIEAIRLGAHDYITKPFSLDQIGITVRNMIEGGSCSSTLCSTIASSPGSAPRWTSAVTSSGTSGIVWNFGTPHLLFGDGPEKTVRYFPDKLPIGMQPHADTHVFVYLVTRPSPMDFRLFLLRHVPLLRVLFRWTVRLLLPAALLSPHP